MAICLKSLKEILIMSMVPVPCQESQLSPSGCITTENIEWLLDLNGKLPIWSRLNTINTSGYNRKLPMGMTKAYDVEIHGRLWSLWGHVRCKKPPICDNCTIDKPYLASTVMALCAARVFRLNIWTSQLLNSIVISGERYLKESLKNFTGRNVGFQLEDLVSECSLEGIHFKVCIKTCQEGRLYSAPFRGCINLAFGLINFLATHQFGIVECFNRFLGFGYLKGLDGGYFMFDAQSMNYPLFGKDQWAPYLLRTNHLQILLYCLIISLNVSYMQAKFYIHRVKIDIFNPHIPKLMRDVDMQCLKPKRILAKECWATSSMSSVGAISAHGNKSTDIKKGLVYLAKPAENCTAKYCRTIQSLPKLRVEDCMIQPTIETTKDLKQNHDFVKMICSETVVPMTADEKLAYKEFSFVTQLPEALFMYGGERSM